MPLFVHDPQHLVDETIGARPVVLSQFHPRQVVQALACTLGKKPRESLMPSSSRSLAAARSPRSAAALPSR